MSAENVIPRTLAYARHIGRELALLSLSSLSQHYDDSDFETLDLAEILERSVRILVSESEDYIESSGKTLEGIHERLDALDPDDIPEVNARDLIESRKQIHQDITQVKAEMMQQIADLANAVNLMGESLQIPLLRTLYGNPQIRSFTIELVRSYRDNKAEIDALIEECLSADWPLDRMNSIDRDLIRIAATEMVFDPIAAFTHQDPTPLPVAINEAVELAKKYGAPESFRFVNGVLRNLLPHAEARRRA